MRGHDEPGSATAAPIETLLRTLLAAEGSRDAESRVVEGVRAMLEGQWAALFAPEGGGWRCSAASGSGPAPDEVWREVSEAEREGDSRSAPHLESEEGAAAALTLDLNLEGRRVLLLVGPREGGKEYGGRNRHALARVAPDVALVLRRGDELDRLRSQAFVDSLTNSYNRRGFDEHLQVELRRAHRYERSAALMLVDLDGFKRINDDLGHQAGDHALRRFAALLTSTFRNTDVVSRYGGDEFAVIFPETTTDEAVGLAQRVRELLGRAFPDDVVPRPVSASFGIASFPRDATSAEALVATADRALYAAKSGGRDRVVPAEPRDGGEE